MLPLLGVPAEGGSNRYLIAAVTSAVLWMILGWVAEHRAARLPRGGLGGVVARVPAAGGGAWAGAGAALMIAATMVGLGSVLT